MTDETAQIISNLLIKKEKLRSAKIYTSSSGLEFQIRYRVKTGMYAGYPFIIELKEFGISEEEMRFFINSKLNEKLEIAINELSAY